MDQIVSVVTITFNAENMISKTIESVLNQSNAKNIEYIIQDGNSKDRTLEIVNQYSSLLQDGLHSFKLASVPDDGIYDAMNKAAEKATGEWIIYMNAGDIFADCAVISDFMNEYSRKTASVVYGNTICVGSGKEEYLKAGSPQQLIYQKPFCHQSVFLRCVLQKKYGFNTSFKIQADYDLFLRLYKKGYFFEFWDRTVSKFDTGGISCDPKNQWLIYFEMLKVHLQNGSFFWKYPKLLPYYIRRFLQVIKIKFKSIM